MPLFADIKTRWLKNPEIKAAYDALEDEFAQIVPTRQRLASFEDDWSSPDMEVYDD